MLCMIDIFDMEHIYAYDSNGTLRREWRWEAQAQALAISMVVVVMVAASTCIYMLLPLELLMMRWREIGKRGGRRIPREPPNAGLIRFPLLGQLPQMLLFSGGLPHRWFSTLSRHQRQKEQGGGTVTGIGGGTAAHAPFLLLWLGGIPALIVSTAPAARLILHDHDIAFASRPATSAARVLSYSADLVFSPYGPYWRKVKELMMKNLFNGARIQVFAPIRTQGLLGLISSISADRASPQLIRTKLFEMTFDNICRMSLGRTARDISPDFMELVHDTLDLLGAFNIGDFLPAIRWLDLQGYERRIKETHTKLDNIVQRIIEERRKEMEAGKNSVKSDNPTPFLDVLLLEFDLDCGSKSKDDCIKAILLNLLIGGSDTTISTIEWALSELLINKEIMGELQDELEKVLRKHHVMEEPHIPELPFLQAVVKETLRLHPPGPLLVPREASSAMEVAGVYVPEKTMVFVNVWAITRDENVWEKPFDFQPHRFLNSSIDVKGHHYELLPFGAGRRACTAMNLGLLTIQQTLATLVHCFEWTLPDGMETIYMNEKYGLATHKAIPLMVKATPRL